MPELGDDELEVRDHRLRAGRAGLGPNRARLGRDAGRALRSQRCAERLDVVGVVRRDRHAGSESDTGTCRQHNRPGAGPD